MDSQTGKPTYDLGLESPEYVEKLKNTWQTQPLDMTVIEFFGTGDAFFGGSNDDRPLGKEGRILSRPYNRDAIAIFPSIDAAHEAAKAITNRRPNSLLGVAPRWRDTEAR